MSRSVCIIAAAALGLAAQPAAAEVVAQSDAGFVTRAAVTVEADPAAAWLALVAPNQWWSDEHTYSGKAANMYIDPQATGCFCEKLPPTKDAPAGARAGSIEHMHVIYAAPARVLRMSGGLGPLQSEAVEGTLTITLKPVDGGTRILWEYVVGGYMRQKVAELAPLVDKVLLEQLLRLRGKLGAGEGEAAPATDNKE